MKTILRKEIKLLHQYVKENSCRIWIDGRDKEIIKEVNLNVTGSYTKLNKVLHGNTLLPNNPTTIQVISKAACYH